MSVQRLISFIENARDADPVKVMVGDCDYEIQMSVMEIVRALGGDPSVVEHSTVAGASVYLLALFMRAKGAAMRTDTPRTDDVAWEADGYDGPHKVVDTKFARILECELASVTEERDRLKRALEEAHVALDIAGVAKGAFGHSVRYRIGALVERAELAEAKIKELEARLHGKD